MCDPVTGQCHCKVSPSIPFSLAVSRALAGGGWGCVCPVCQREQGWKRRVPELQPACPMGWWVQSTLESPYLLILPGHGGSLTHPWEEMASVSPALC